MTEALAAKILDGAPFFRVISDGKTTPVGDGKSLASVMNKLNHGEERGHFTGPNEHTAIVPMRRLVTGGAFKLFAESLR